MVLMDFGKFQLIKTDFQKKNTTFLPKTEREEPITNDSDFEEEETYMTPCSTPPASEKSGSESPTLNENFFTDLSKNNQLESALHSKIYNTYTINLTNLQVLVCKYQERWQPSLKTSSSFHLIDKFNITLTIQQRIVFTYDPDYPSFTLFGKCPMILIHGNEEKIKNFVDIVYPITNSAWPNDYASTKTENKLHSTNEAVQSNYNSDGSHLVVKFEIGQLIVEMQSKEKGIAELQINGARAGFTTTSEHTTISMSVHGLLLVDAIQPFGSDFELLVASHRNVG